MQAVKKEFVNGRSSRVNRSSTQDTTEAPGATGDAEPADGPVEARVLRSKYLRFKSRISDERDDISKVDSDKFKSIIEEADNLHEHVQKPREQLADAEALYDITNTLVSSVKSYRNEGITPTDFINCLLGEFGPQGGASSSNRGGESVVRWNDIGQVVCHVFRSAPGCNTMVGPMNTEIKQRKPVVHKKRTRPTENSHPEELDVNANKEKTDTDKNMAIMFDILRRNRKVKLENLILNRNSFAQTVENLFALSFLIKDGRAQISVDGNGCHLVSPRNAPSASAIQSGEASYSHFIFRYDFRDWKLMLASTVAGEELMPHRIDEFNGASSSAQADSESEEAQPTLPTTPIRKLCRNRGLVMQEQAVVEDSPESDRTNEMSAKIRKAKRRMR